MVIHLPVSVTLEVVEADPVVKGQTASSSYKPAKLSNGVKTMVPPFIETGETHRRPHRGRAATWSARRADRAMALRLSPHLTVMANAAQKAAKRLLRDFAEVEQLQVSVKGPSDFVSPGRSARRADAARGAEQGAPRLCLPDGGIRRLGLRQLDLALGGRSAGRHHQLPARHSALGDQHRAGTAPAGRRVELRGRQ